MVSHNTTQRYVAYLILLCQHLERADFGSGGQANLANQGSGKGKIRLQCAVAYVSSNLAERRAMYYCTISGMLCISRSSYADSGDLNLLQGSGVLA